MSESDLPLPLGESGEGGPRWKGGWKMIHPRRNYSKWSNDPIYS